MIGFEGSPRYARLIEALTGDSEIVPPGIILEVDRPEYSILKRERLWAANFKLAASAGNFNLFALAVPNDGSRSDVISVVTHIFSDQTSHFGFLAQTGMTAGPGAEGGLQFRDARRQGSPTSLQFVKQQAAQQLAGAKYFGGLTANNLLAIPEFILAGNRNFIIESVVVNIAQGVQMFGYEREQRREEIEL